MSAAKLGKYSFWVPGNLTKTQIKRVIGEIFEVKVLTVKTLNYKKLVKTSSLRRSKITKSAKKKAIVTLKEGDKINLFGEEEKKSKKEKKKK